MGRSGYCDDYGDEHNLWRGAVMSAIHGRRGQAFLREMLAAMDALPAPRLIMEELQDATGEVCAIGTVGRSRGVDMLQLDPEDHDELSRTFGIAGAMVQEIEYVNDECGVKYVKVDGGRRWEQHEETPEERFVRVRIWIVKHLGAPDAD